MGTTLSGQYVVALTRPDVGFGVWNYAAGVSGTRAITGRVIGIAVHSTSGGSMSINSGDNVPIPANVGIAWVPMGNLVNPSITFTGTDSYVIEFVN